CSSDLPRLVRTSPLAQPPEHGEDEGVVLVEGDSQRCPEFRRARKAEAARHDAYDDVGYTVDVDGTSDDARVRRKALAPDPVAEDDDVLAVVVWRESPADRGGDAQHAEEVCVHTGPGEPRGIPRAGERSCATRVPRDALERALTLAVVQPLPVDQS